MGHVDNKWVRDQFTRAQVRLGVGTAVLQLLEAWEAIELTDKEAEEALAIFEKVAQSQALLEDNPGNELWVPVQRGAILVNDTVRVKVDAFKGVVGQLHNGRRGKIVAIRSGDIIFRSTDDIEPAIDGAHYPPDMLEKRIR